MAIRAVYRSVLWVQISVTSELARLPKEAPGRGSGFLPGHIRPFLREESAGRHGDQIDSNVGNGPVTDESRYKLHSKSRWADLDKIDTATYEDPGWDDVTVYVSGVQAAQIGVERLTRSYDISLRRVRSVPPLE